MVDALIIVDNCYKIYREKKTGVETVALRGIDLQIRHGELLTLVGPSGSGKTTLLNLLSGLDEPSAGRVIYNLPDSQPIILSNMDAQTKDEFRSQNIGLIFQTPMLLPQYTALENVQLPLHLNGEEQVREKAKRMLLELGLGQRLKSKPRQLSAGEKQRVAIASALVFDPILLLADEPTGELDSQTTAEVLDFLQDFHDNKGITMLLVSHNPAVAKRGRRTLRLHDGQLMEHVKIEYNMVFVEDIDKFGRIVLPNEVMEVLHYPEIIRVEGTKSPWRLYNASLRAIDPNDRLIAVDRNNRVLIQEIFRRRVITRQAKLTIHSPTKVELELNEGSNTES